VPTILCVDDDPYQTDLLRYGLARAGFDVVTAGTGREGLQRARTAPVDLVILDVDIPDRDTAAALIALCARTTIPVIMLTARARDEDIIAGLDQGADDYVVKPFNMQVLVLRVQAVLRRVVARTSGGVVDGTTGRTQHRIAGALFDADMHELTAADGTRVRLTPTESRILALLVVHAGQVLAAARIMECLWGHTSESDVNVIKTHVRHLREKIAMLPGSPHPIRTIPGVGYAAPRGDTERVEETQAVQGLRALA